MPFSIPPLKIGFNPTTGDHANPDPYFVDIGKPIPVQVDEDCFVIFDKPSVLPSGGHHAHGNHTWKPKCTKKTDIHYVIGPDKSNSPPITGGYMHTIKVGSGGARKPKGKPKKAKKQRAKAKRSKKRKK
jgi:hypothetical protein